MLKVPYTLLTLTSRHLQINVVFVYQRPVYTVQLSSDKNWQKLPKYHIFEVEKNTLLINAHKNYFIQSISYFLEKLLKMLYFLDFRSDPDPFFSRGRSRIWIRIKLIRIHITATQRHGSYDLGEMRYYFKSVEVHFKMINWMTNAWWIIVFYSHSISDFLLQHLTSTLE